MTLFFYCCSNFLIPGLDLWWIVTYSWLFQSLLKCDDYGISKLMVESVLLLLVFYQNPCVVDVGYSLTGSLCCK
jgi:hypothetical protein